MQERVSPAAAPVERPAPAPVDPQAGQKAALAEMGMGEKFLAGMGGSAQGLSLGAQQLFANAFQGEDRQKQLMDEVAEHKRMMAPLEDTGAGMAGSVGGNILAAIPVGMLAGAAAPAVAGYAGLTGGAAELAALTGAGLTEGGIMGALAPTSKEGERTKNIAWGAGLGGAIPVAGKGVRKLVGETDPVVAKAAETLKKYGISTPKGDIAPGALSKTSDYVLENAPVINNVLKARAGGKEEKVRSALFQMLGKEVPTSGEGMEAIVKELGADIGAATAGKTASIAGAVPAIDDVVSSYSQLLPAQRNANVTKIADQLRDLSQFPGAKLKGEAYQAIRADLGHEAATAAPAHQKALFGLQKALDDEFGKVLSAEEAASLTTKKGQYRLAKALQNVPFKEGEFDLGRARSSVERVARKGKVMPEARELLQAADVAIPKIKTGLKPGTLAEGALAAYSLPALAKVLGAGVATKGVLNTGIPQYLAASPLVREKTAQGLRGYIQSELSDED